MVTKRITRPHEVVYSSQDYDEMSAALFVNAFLTVMEKRQKLLRDVYKLRHLQELMEHAKAYIWTGVRDYHAAWLHHVEQGKAACGDEFKKIKLRRALMWH